MLCMSMFSWKLRWQIYLILALTHFAPAKFVIYMLKENGDNFWIFSISSGKDPNFLIISLHLGKAISLIDIASVWEWIFVKKKDILSWSKKCCNIFTCRKRPMQKTIKQFGLISLLDGKIFWGILSKRTMAYLQSVCWWNCSKGHKP